ncbi:MAG: WYL domain-containing protein [Lachnospiraceae bacterium]|nr:WYL domain-containing protein [Lachnospiraceae bacterium]
MMFSELYSAYYNAVAAILNEAQGGAISDEKLREIIEKHAFTESVLNIEPALKNGDWPLIKDGISVLKHEPAMPLTTIQKRWLRAISMDRRLKLFGDDTELFPEVEPLFTQEDVEVFDRFLDGDDYGDENYRENFRIILDAIKNRYPLRLKVCDRRGNRYDKIVRPWHLEYSEKDDKFRLITSGKPYPGAYNLGRIISCKRVNGRVSEASVDMAGTPDRSVTFELTDERRALERVLMHFAHLKKEVERLGDNNYRVTLHYDGDDEAEMVIRILSFGPVIHVVEPKEFVELIRERLMRQRSV